MTRSEWLSLLDGYASILADLLNSSSPIFVGDKDRGDDVSTLELLGRVAYSVAPYLDTEGEEEPRKSQLQGSLSDLVKEYFASRRRVHQQNIIDLSFLVQYLMQVPCEQDDLVLAYIDELNWTYKPLANNWLLATAMLEVYRWKKTGRFDQARVDRALRFFDQAYVGDSFYRDGPSFCFNYYNSLVIHPYLDTILREVGDLDSVWKEIKAKQEPRSARQAQILERLIATDGSFPIVGRSASYRAGVFNHLANHVCRSGDTVFQAQALAALGAVAKRFTETFLTKPIPIGFVTEDVKLGEPYITSSSVYAIGFILRVLGLPALDPAWEASQPWTQRVGWESSPPMDFHLHDIPERL